MQKETCPCCSGHAFESCCEPYLAGTKPAPTAEALMRSRYAAFATGNIDYLSKTLFSSIRGTFDRKSVTDWARTSEWTGLEIKRTESGGEKDEEGVVEFVARFRQNGKDYSHPETSRFVKDKGQWYYAGIVKDRPAQNAKPGRNDPCSCGSGQKYKKCCGKND